MKHLLLVIAFIIVILMPMASHADKVVRDRYGRLIETWTDHGDTTDIRNQYGTLEATRTYRNGTVEIRDRNGTLIGTEKYDRGRK